MASKAQSFFGLLATLIIVAALVKFSWIIVQKFLPPISDKATQLIAPETHALKEQLKARDAAPSLPRPNADAQALIQKLREPSAPASDGYQEPGR